jgi:hypothetical protein
MPKRSEVNPGQFTVPQPFELSTGVKTDERKQRAMALERERYLNECTFKPQTNEGRNRKLLQEIMEAEALIQQEQRELAAAN